MRLSKRLELVASFVEEGSRIADVGTDHGYIPIALVEREIVQSAVAMDLRQGPLQRAKEHIAQAGLSGRIETRLSDGLLALNCGEADTVIIAGMGGGLVVHILEDGRRLWREVKRFVLSPQSDLEMVRRYLGSSGFLTEEEAMTEEEGKYYTVMAVRLKNEKELENPAEGNERISAAACQARLRYGRCLIERKDPVLADYLEREEARIRSVLEKLRGQKGSDSTLSDRQRSALEQLKADLEVLQEARREMQMPEPEKNTQVQAAEI